MARLSSSAQLALDYHKFLVGCPHDDSNGPIIIAKPHRPSQFNVFPDSQPYIYGTWVPYTEHKYTKHQTPSFWNRPFQSLLYDAAWDWCLLHETGVCYWVWCTRQPVLLHSSLNVTEEDVITACVPDTVEEIQVWGSPTLMNWGRDPGMG